VRAQGAEECLHLLATHFAHVHEMRHPNHFHSFLGWGPHRRLFRYSFLRCRFLRQGWLLRCLRGMECRPALLCGLSYGSSACTRMPNKQRNNRRGFIVGVGLTVQSAIRYQGRIRGRNKGKETTSLLRPDCHPARTLDGFPAATRPHRSGRSRRPGRPRPPGRRRRVLPSSVR